MKSNDHKMTKSNALTRYRKEIESIPLMDANQERLAFDKLCLSEINLISHLFSNKNIRKVIIRDLEKSINQIPKEIKDFLGSLEPEYYNNFISFIKTSEGGYDWYNRSISASIDLAKKERLEWNKKFHKLNSSYRRAKALCVNANLRLVTGIARQHLKVNSSMSMVDLVQEGNIGLIKAVEKYDTKYDVRFSTYAVWWIRASIRRSIQNNESMIRLPVHIQYDIRAIYRANEEFIKNNNREANHEELSINLCMPLKKVERVLKSGLLGITKSTDAQNPNNEDGEPFINSIEDYDYVSPDQRLNQRRAEFMIKALFDVLSHRESQVLQWRFGFNNQDPLTLKEVGEKLSLTRERVRQIELSALEKLRNPKVKRIYGVSEEFL